MHNILQRIIEQKQKEVFILKENAISEDAFSILQQHPQLKRFRDAISNNKLSFIGEIKRKSPSSGKLTSMLDPLPLLSEYVQGGISAVSVLTDEKYFSGSLGDMEIVIQALEKSSIPVLRKDFIIDEIQIIQSILSGANAILLIVSVLKDKTKDLLQCAKNLGIDAIVEVHNKRELYFAIEIGSEIIGINNRDLNTFTQDINVCLNLVSLIPDGILRIAESAIKTPNDVKKINNAGFDAVLIGEALVTADHPSMVLSKMKEVL